MSTLSLDAALYALEESNSEQSDAFATFMRSREAAAERRIVRHLKSQTDDRLIRLGFSADDIATLRAGNLRFPKI